MLARFFILVFLFSALFSSVYLKISSTLDDDDTATDPSGGHDHGYLLGLPPYTNVTETRCREAYANILFQSYQCHEHFNVYIGRLINFQVTRNTLKYLCEDRECFSIIRNSVNYVAGNCTAWFRPGFYLPSFQPDFENILCTKSQNGDYCASILTSSVSLSSSNKTAVTEPDMGNMTHHRRSVHSESDDSSVKLNFTVIRGEIANHTLFCDNCTTTVLQKLSENALYRNFVGEQLAFQRMLCLKDGSTSCLEKTVNLLASAAAPGSDALDLDPETLQKLLPKMCSSFCAMKVLCCILSAEEYNHLSKLCSKSPTDKYCYEVGDESIDSCEISFNSENVTFPSTCYGVCKTRWLAAEDEHGCCMYSFLEAFSPRAVSSMINFHDQCHNSLGHNHDEATMAVMSSCQGKASQSFSRSIYFPNVKFSFFQTNSNLFRAALLSDLAVSYFVSTSSISNLNIFRTKANQVAASYIVSVSSDQEAQVVTGTPTSFLRFDYMKTVVTTDGLIQPFGRIYALENTEVLSGTVSQHTSTLMLSWCVGIMVLSLMFLY